MAAVDLNRLYQAVYEAPRDDQRKLVLADALQMAGDPRGDFITLQLRDSVITRRRSDKLLARNRVAFLGPLAPPVLAARGAGRRFEERWDRGFLAACTVRLDGTLVDCPAWATVESIGVYESDVAPAELGSAWFTSLRDVWVVGSPAFAGKVQSVVHTRHPALRIKHVDSGAG